MTYIQITSQERYLIAVLRREGYNQSQIARCLGRHRSTISREVRRNAARLDGAYRAQKAISEPTAAAFVRAAGAASPERTLCLWRGG